MPGTRVENYGGIFRAEIAGEDGEEPIGGGDAAFFEDLDFLAVGGVILAPRMSLPELEQRVSEDPFVREKVVQAEILTVDTGRADERLSFLVS